ncbi:MAG: metalloregulator ArsR/SmtB family transcription factor [Acidimicrobiales bacterium]
MSANGGMQRIFDALASPVRRELLWLVRDREVSAGDLARMCELSPATMSQHLTVLRRAGLVRQRAEGTFRLYQAEAETLARIHTVLAAEDSRWLQAHPHPEARHTVVSHGRVLTAGVTIPASRQDVFDAFVDAKTYSRWFGADVSIVDGRFHCTMPNGMQVRGRYDHVVEPSLIVMVWDFSDGDVPLPGDELVAYGHFTAAGDHPDADVCTVEVRQLVPRPEQLLRLTSAWTMVLGRLYEYFAPES